MIAKLVVIAGPEVGKTFEVVPNVPLVIGRSREADGRVNDPRVSPFHCRVEVRHGQLFAVDLDSATGTAVNNVFVLEYTLQFGDTLTVGDSTLLVQDPDAAEVVPAHIGSKTGGRMPTVPRPAMTTSAAPRPTAPHLPGPTEPPPAPKTPPRPTPAAAGTHEKLQSKLPERFEQLPGQVISNYQIEKLIARARTGAIFRAFDQKASRPVALKVLHPSHTADDKAVERFTKAMKLALPLRHPNVVSVYGAGKARPYCWFAMELVNGDSLTATIRHVGVAGSLDWRRALRMSIYLARGLNYLHEQKVIYRNIGPQNIMVEGEARIPRLSDFVRARPFFDPVEDAKAEELPDSLLLYASPEQTREELELDYRSDIFNLGSLIYQLMTGRPPFEGGSLAETITKIRREKPENPKKYQLAIPEAFQGIVLQMLAKRAEDRYQTVAEVLTDLEKALKYQGMTL
jgi:pSer/pThr/pTyr-binding forkhead associated (FHA) protein